MYFFDYSKYRRYVYTFFIGKFMDFYKNLTRKRKISLFILFIVLIVLCIADLTIGYYDVDLRILLPWNTINGESIERVIMFKFRLPKTFTCLVVGTSLGLAGYCIQNILKNPIANPFTLGISSAASTGAALSIITGFPFLMPAINTQISAILFTFFCTYIMLFTLNIKRMDSRTMILFGVILNFFFQAMTSLLQYIADEKQVQQIIQWTFGSFERASWTSVLVIAITFTICFIYLYLKSWDLNLLSLSEDQAQAMGLNVERTRKIFFFGSSIVTAIAISYVGTIGFVGLIAPHLSRFILGNDSRYTLPASALLGAVVLLLASIISKLIIPGGLLPVGIITNILGVPFMAYIIFGKERK